MIVGVGAALIVVLSIVLARTGEKLVAWTMLGVLLMTAALVAVERAVVTDTEAIAAALDGIAAALERNDVEGVLGYVSPSATTLRSRAKREMQEFTLREARVLSGLTVDIDPPGAESAKAHFNGRFQGQDRRGTVPYNVIVLHFDVTLHKEGGRWLVTGAEFAEPRR